MKTGSDSRSGDLKPPSDASMDTYAYGTVDQVSRFTSTTKDIAAFVGTTYKQGKEMYTLLTDNDETTFTEPTAPLDDKNRAEMEKYKMLLSTWINDEKDYKRDKARVFRTIMTQCTTAMKNKVEGLSDYKKMETDDDVVSLLKAMKELVYSTDKAQYEYWTMQATMRKFMNLKQATKETMTDFHKRFLNQLEATETVWGKMIPQIENDKNTSEQNEARDKYLACVFLAGVDRQRHKDVIDELNNDFLLGKVNYPSDTSGMLTLLTNRRGNGGTSQQEQALRDGESEGTSLHQAEEDHPDQHEHPEVKCYNCNKMGHYAGSCRQEMTKKTKQMKKKKALEAAALAQQGEETESDSDEECFVEFQM